MRRFHFNSWNAGPSHGLSIISVESSIRAFALWVSIAHVSKALEESARQQASTPMDDGNVPLEYTFELTADYCIPRDTA